MLLQKEAAENSKSVATISKFYQTEQTRLQVHASQTAQELTAAERESSGLEKQLADLNSKLLQVQAELGKADS